MNLPATTTSNSILWLNNVDLEHRLQVGGKAATLGTLRRAGLPVPNGFCIPQQEIPNGPHYLSEITKAYHLLAPQNQPVAVRSSGVAEDSAEASFAGQYDTVLDVRGAEALVAAVEQCWQSTRSARAQAYQAKSGRGDERVAVLVQQQIPATVSGVMFTADPLSGSDEDILIEAVPGLGEALVSGRVTPARYQIKKQNDSQTQATNGLLSAGQCQTLAALGVKIEQLLGTGQDIEWALVNDQFYILQARPITTNAMLVSLTDVWTRANIGEVLPHVITPLTWEIFRSTLLHNPQLFWDESGTEEIGHEGIRRIFGRGYIRLDGLLNSFCYLPNVTPQILGRVLGVKVPPAAAPYVRPNGVPVRLAQALFYLDAFGILPRLSWLTKQLPPAPADPAENLAALITWTSDCFRLHLKCTAYAIGAFGMLADYLKRWQPAQAEALLPQILVGNEDLQTAAQGIALWRLAEQAQASPALLKLLNSELEWPALASQLAATPGGDEFLEAFYSFLEKNGARAAGEFELAVPRWREDPSFVLSVLRQYLNSPEANITDDLAARHRRRERAVAELEQSLNWWQRRALSRLLSSYSHYTTLRENIKYRLIEGYALLRQTFLAMGSQLVGHGILKNVNDVFFLKPSEILALIKQGESIEQLSLLISDRKQQHAHWAAQHAPDLIVGEGQEFTDAANELNGIGCSPGVVEGLARVLFDPHDSNALRPGEILVAPHTDPGWTPLFLSCKGVVTEIGGFLSHGATVAREYGVPAVVNVSQATAKIQTGDLIRVDGTNGRVIICNQGS